MADPLGPARSTVGIREVRSDGTKLAEAMVLDVIGGVSRSTGADGIPKYVLSLAAGVTFAAVKAALAAASSAIGVNSQKITNLATPTVATDASTKGYVDTATATVPTAAEKAALAGTNGAPGGGNAYVTDSDPRNTNSRAPTAHAASHTNGTDQIANASGVAAGLMVAADYTKLSGIEALADVTDFANVSSALAAATGSVSVNSQKITNLATPTVATDASTKGYVDGLNGGEWHFGATALPNSGVYSYLDFGGGHATSTSATMRAVRAVRDRTITEIHFTHNAGTGTAIFRFAIYINGVDSGSYLDVPITDPGGDTTGSPIPAVAVGQGDNVSVMTKIQSGAIVGADSNPTVTLLYTEP